MSLSEQDVARLAHLARLAITPEQTAQLRTHLNGFFALADALAAVDTQGVEPLAHPLAAVQDVALRLQPDEASEPDNRSANQQNAPAVEDGLFLVPRVIE